MNRLQKYKQKCLKYEKRFRFTDPPTTCLYAGRFQPFHLGHYYTFLELCKTCGMGNCYIVTSNKTDGDKSPFNFEEKKFIIETLFPDLEGKVILESSPYRPRDERFQETIHIFGLGVKDENRFKIGKTKKGKDTWFQRKDECTSLSTDHAYITIIPQQTITIQVEEDIPISGTFIREKWKENTGDKGEFIQKYYKLEERKIKVTDENMVKLINIFYKIK